MEMNAKTISGMITALILLVILFKVAAVMIPEAQSAGDELNASGIPFGSLFSGNGVIFIVIVAALLLAVVYAFMPHSKK